MLDRMTYKNHLGEVIEFGKDGLYINYSDVRDYAWAYDSNNNKISNFNKGVVTKQLPFVIKADDGDSIRNHIYEVADKDVQAGVKGTLHIGEYYMKCFIYSISNLNFLINKGYKTGTIGICTDSAYWNCDKSYSFEPVISSEADGFEYPFDYPFEYKNVIGNEKILDNPFSFDSDFIITVYGATQSIEIYINGHMYKVNTTLDENEILKINSVDKTIIKYLNDGTTSNEFNNRYKPESVFEKIVSGTNSVNWSGSFGFDITLIDNRSEPKWGD